ncbi:MAG: lycopene cyclase [Proteobacteria bacterium]|nr:lycopene cyclase [Pseudomonadota bacterium]
MHHFDYDIVFVGGGLVNGLLAWQLKRIKPWVRFLILERAISFGGRSTWSFHEKDLTPEALRWITPLISASWPFYQVAFPEYERQLESRYYSIRSRKFHEVLHQELAENVRFNTDVLAVSENQVVLKDGTIISAKQILDGRGKRELEKGACGFQKFFGLEVELNHPHGLKAPILMDATVKQKDGYRFFYCLPWSENRLLIEDTRYSETPDLDSEECRREILEYCAEKNWQVREVFYEETGCLPLPLKNQFWLGSRSSESLRETSLTVGMRAGLFHPTTGYSLPMAVQTVELLIKSHDQETWPQLLERFSEGVYHRQKFFVLLNRVMFLAGRPERRFQFLQHFYRLPGDLIDSFYAHRLSSFEKVRFFLRTPPVPISAAFSALRRELASDT